MSSYDYIFLDPVPQVNESELVDDLDAALRTKFDKQPSAYAAYLYSSPGLALDLGTHDFDNDRDMLFEEYPYVLTVRKVGRDLAFQTNAAQRMFNALKNTSRYRLLLVSDLQTKLNEFDPQHTSTGASP